MKGVADLNEIVNRLRLLQEKEQASLARIKATRDRLIDGLFDPKEK